MNTSCETSKKWLVAVAATVAAATLLVVSQPTKQNLMYAAAPVTSTATSSVRAVPASMGQMPLGYQPEGRVHSVNAYAGVDNSIYASKSDSVMYTSSPQVGGFNTALVAISAIMAGVVAYLWKSPKQQQGLLMPMDVDLGSPSIAMAATYSEKPQFGFAKPMSRRDFTLSAEAKKRQGPHTYEPFYEINGTKYYTDEYCNTTTRIMEKVGTNLHLVPNHPLNILKKKIEASFGPEFKVFDDLTPVVSTFQNFDTLLIPEGHPARSPTDTYYLNKDTLMRPHTSAHQHDLLCEGNTKFLCSGDVYRRDEIDRTHFWCFHQCEGVKVMDTTDNAVIEADLKASLEGMIKNLFGDLKADEIRWVDAYFPFTEPSWEMEIMWQGEWLEVLGCGIMQQKILEGSGADAGGTKKAWAFGIGLERIAMPLFKIPDIRIFWSENKRFLSQFEDGEIKDFEPLLGVKDFPANNKDISMWVPEGFTDNDFFDMIQNLEYANLIEEVELFDEFTNPKTGRNSKAFHVVFRSPERTLPTEEVNVHMEDLRAQAVEVLGVELR